MLKWTAKQTNKRTHTDRRDLNTTVKINVENLALGALSCNGSALLGQRFTVVMLHISLCMSSDQREINSFAGLNNWRDVFLFTHVRFLCKLHHRRPIWRVALNWNWSIHFWWWSAPNILSVIRCLEWCRMHLDYQTQPTAWYKSQDTAALIKAGSTTNCCSSLIERSRSYLNLVFAVRPYIPRVDIWYSGAVLCLSHLPEEG